MKYNLWEAKSEESGELWVVSGEKDRRKEEFRIQKTENRREEIEQKITKEAKKKREKIIRTSQIAQKKHSHKKAQKKL